MTTELTAVTLAPADLVEVGRNKVLRLEAEIAKLEQVDMPVNHLHMDGVYARELFIPKGTVLTGKIHKHEQINIISSGEISVLSENGRVVRIKAPYSFVSAPGAKRAGYAHEDTIWITISANKENTRDLEQLERNLIAETFADVPMLAGESVAQIQE